ncbi:MAG: FHA domain-containing protein [Pseudomonadota bacterium]
MTNEKTKWIFDDGDDAADAGGKIPGNEMTESLDGPSYSDPTFVGSDAPTELVDRGVKDDAPEKTTIYTSRNAKQHQEPAGFADDSDPVTGWLVVVKGPGLGQSVALGAGLNGVGRGAAARVSLPFGDTLISSDDHVRIIYDDADRAFYIAHGSGKNISRVNGQLLANMLPLETDSRIELSKATTVVFKPFCSTDFDWSDIDTDQAATE